MKFLVLLCLIFLCTCFMPTVLSQKGRLNRLYELLRQNAMDSKIQYPMLPIGKNKDFSDEEIHSAEYEDSVRIRNTWDSGEDYYFQWANQHRRPVEYLTGRKRDTSKIALPARDRRINGGLWRSGLVG